jgi:hypothetical protein
MAQAQGNDALLSQILPAGISWRSDVAGGSGNMVAFRGDSHSSLRAAYGETGAIKVKLAAVSGTFSDLRFRSCGIHGIASHANKSNG